SRPRAATRPAVTSGRPRATPAPRTWPGSRSRQASRSKPTDPEARPMANKLFASGFEGGVSLAPAGDDWQEVVGTDSVTGQDWNATVFGGGNAIQILKDGGAISNSIETVAGHDGHQTRALNLGVDAQGNGSTQAPLLFMPDTSRYDVTDLYQSAWVKLPADLPSLLGAGGWLQLGANWKSAGDFRFNNVITVDNAGVAHFRSGWDNNANGGLPLQTFWATENRSVAVPLGEWFKVEAFTHRGETDGYTSLSINGQIVAEHSGDNIGVNHAPINRIFMGQAYGNAAFDVLVDDIEIWDGKPTAAPQPATPQPAAPASLSAGAGSDALVLKISQDAYQGSAQYTVKVDGQQVGETFTASAWRSAGQSDTLTLKGDWGPGEHKVEVEFLNDAWGGTAATDRNLYVDGAAYNGKALAGAAADLMSAGSASFGFTEDAPPPAHPPKSLAAGAGPDSLVLDISQDHYQGDAQYTVSVDGRQVGDTFTASALRSDGEHDTLTLRGDWGAGEHRVEVEFLNDAWGGTAATDRNLFVEGATYNGEAVEGAAKAFMGAGPQSFAFSEGGGSGAGPGDPQFRETFFDGFDGAAVDRSKWTITYGGGDLYWNGAFRWDNSELSVSDGALHIGLTKQADGVWTTSGLSTTPTDWAPGFSMTHGKVEIRAKASQEVDGAGPCFLLWPATNDHWPPEVDILETPHGNGMFTNHWAGPKGEDTYESEHFDIDYSQWHVYGLEWTPDRLTMTVDGVVMGEITGNIPTEAMSIGLQGHVGGANDGWYGNANASGADHVDIAVDYVRVYELAPLG
ncbi:MAG: family 16 glycosylhydrolase, partial [Acetobacteraceae bacterium]|nr:family 16 glycosylhydrolase [Acetobacteraceae bacterium]